MPRAQLLPLTVRLRDLTEWHVLTAKCELCLHRKVLDPARLLARFQPKYGADVTLLQLNGFLRCTRCERKDRSKTFELTMMER